MRTTINLEPEAYRLARAVAAQRHQTVGKVLGDAVLGQFRSNASQSENVLTDDYGFPIVHFGRVITPEDVAAAIEEE